MTELTSDVVFLWLYWAVVLLVTLASVKNIARRRKQNLPPGPRGLPLFGNLLQLGNLPYETFEKWYRIYGDIFMFSLGGKPVVVLNRYSTIRQALVQNARAFAGRPYSFLFHQVAGDKSVIASNYSPVVKLQRRIVLTVFHKLLGCDNVRLRTFLNKQARRLCARLSEKTRGEGAFYPRPVIEKNIAATQYEVCFGKSKTSDDLKIQESLCKNAETFTNFAGVGNLVDLYPWVRHFIPKTWKKIVKSAQFLFVVSEKRFDGYYQENFHPNNQKTVLETLVELMSRNEQMWQDAGVCSSRVKGLLADLFGAGFETVVTSIDWAVLLLASHPDVHSKMKKEITCVLGDEEISYELRGRLPYTQATIAEILRFSCIVPISLPHCTCEDVKFRGYFIPKDTFVMVNLHSVHMDPTMWNHPNKFNPERFMTTEGTFDKELRQKILPFSIGRRMCLGKQLAEMMFFTFVGVMARECSFSMIEPPTSKPQFGLTLKPPNFKISVVREDV